ncbi:ABC transporter ATP-binding protein [Marinicella sp. S1101]|uniref:ABC transporter ATP-binding protein n=1 Tax=Marinicella marina TaxID=2996016 RepID=UPI002260DE91|nr:ABC transporter ATP-binding protein [Marinicella marina]MCX7553999.1 ABC transporter ATP-binding protein [Marinicella marina]MDJ1140491.1 ABC transporter ATP-binding protein [Marinicella marina]
MQHEHIAQIHQVSKKFDENLALDQVSLDIRSGEVLGILGPNGAGKTTLINLMLGRMALTTGEVSIFGLKPGSIELKRQCGAMLQLSGLPDMSTVKEHIELFMSYYANPFAYQKIIDLAGLAGIEDQYSKTLSGGQKQRLLFALAICGNPKLLFLDEPSVGMDIETRKSLWHTINELKANGTSVILTTHYLEEADQLSDRIIMLNQGKIIHQGTPDEIKANINTKKIRFISSTPLAELMSIGDKLKITSSGKYYEIQSKDSSKILRKLFQVSDDIQDLTVTGAALEDAFIQLNQANPMKTNAAGEEL